MPRSTLALAVAGIWWMSYGPRELPPEVAPAEEPSTEGAPDTGSTALGDGGVTSRVATEEEPISAEAVSVDMPKQPLPGQLRAPCRRRGTVEINGGCWAPGLTLALPCGDESYEWNGVCYLPLFERTRRVPNSTKPQ
jgi:hypothetical protein